MTTKLYTLINKNNDRLSVYEDGSLTLNDVTICNKWQWRPNSNTAGYVIVNGKTYSFSGITADQIEALNNATHNNKQATTVREKNATSARVIAYYESFEEYCNGDQYAKNVLLAKNSTAEEYTKGLDDQIAKLQQQRAEKIAYHTAVNAMEDCNAHLVEKWQKQNDQAKLQAMKKTISYEDALRRLMELEGNA